MRFAKDKRSGVELSAKKAVAGRTYACPVCLEDVYVRGGFIRVRHFAHRSGRADPECENYHGGSAISHPLTSPSGGAGEFGVGQNTQADPLKLGFRVEAAASVTRGERRRWRLVLTLPKSPTGIGRMRVPTGFANQSREVRLFTLCQAPQDIDISPNATRFGPEWVSDEVDYAYRESVSERLEGFSPETGYAFSASAAKVKPQASNFDWGDSYYIIWKRPGVVVPDALNALHLAIHEGWSAALIVLPPTPIDEIAVWLGDLFCLRIQEAKRRWGILYPPPIDIDLEDGISICDTARIFLGFSEAADGATARSTLSLTTTGSQQQCLTKPGESILLHVLRDALDTRGSLRIRWGSKDLPSVRAVAVVNPMELLPRVALRIRDTQSDHDRTVCFDRPEAREALSAIRRGQADLIALSAPHSLAGILEQRKGGSAWTRSLHLMPGVERIKGNAWIASPGQLAVVAEALSDLDNDVRLSFGIFGEYVALSPRQWRASRPCLSPDTRRRMIWYCRANGLTGPDGARVIHASNDDVLIDEFYRISPRPSLIAYQNLLRRRLRTEGAARRGT